MNHKITAYIEGMRNNEDLTSINEDSGVVKECDKIGQLFQLGLLETTNKLHLFDEPDSFKSFVALSVLFNIGFVLYLISGKLL